MANFERANGGGGGVLSLEPTLAAPSAAEETVRHHDWDKNDYKAFIRSQRAARTLQQQQQQQQQQHDDEGDAAFAFRNSCPTPRIRESCEEQHMKSMERDHHDSQAQMLYLDMDAALPLHWESMINTSCRSRRHSYSSSSSSSSSSSREFEFHMQQVQIRPEVVAGAEDAAAGDHHLHVGRDVVQGISHADELFYKGQLLPLHLRPRQQMVEKLTSEYSHVNQQEKAAATVAAAASDDDHAAALLDSSSYVKFCVNSYTDDLHVAAAAAALADSRSSSFRSQSSSSSSYWESATAENSSSRDSNGSSQDACCFVNSSNNDNELQLLETQLSATNVGALRSKPPPLIKLSSFQKQELQKQQESPFLHNREVFSTHMNCCKSAPSQDADQSTTKSTTSVFSSWLRPPFKWKVLFGVKKVSKTPTRKDQTTLERCNPLSTPESSYSSSSSSSYSSSACSPTSSYSAAADLVHSHAPDHPEPNKHSTSSSEADSRISSCEIRKSTAAREPAADEEESLRASAACSSAGAAAGESSKTTREHQQQHRWKKYIKMLKLPAYGKIMQQQQKQQQHIFDLVKIDFKNVAAATAASEPISSSNPAAAAAAAVSSSSRRAGSLSFIKPAAAAPPPPPPPQAQAPKSLSGSLSFPSSSMMSPTSRMAAAAMGGGGVPGAPRRSSAHASDSTSNSGQLLLRPVFSQSTISDLQSSLQGAIAHCKQSHCAHI